MALRLPTSRRTMSSNRARLAAGSTSWWQLHERGHAVGAGRAARRYRAEGRGQARTSIWDWSRCLRPPWAQLLPRRCAGSASPWRPAAGGGRGAIEVGQVNAVAPDGHLVQAHDRDGASHRAERGRLSDRRSPGCARRISGWCSGSSS